MRALWIAVSLAACAAGCSRQETGWRDALRADSIVGYEAYLAQFPAGAHAGEASLRILALREEQDWTRANRLRTPEAWQRHLSGWPEGRHAAEARELLAAFVPPAVAGQRWSVQLGAFSTEAAAGAARERLSALHAQVLRGLELAVIAPPEGGDGDIWRLRTGGLPEEESRALCGRLRDDGVDCVPVAE
ncbi:MAG: SPOR domain-containing protein [Gammaproteobacteria bacterium]